MQQARYWILTIPYDHYTPNANQIQGNLVYIRGQCEVGQGNSPSSPDASNPGGTRILPQQCGILGIEDLPGVQVEQPSHSLEVRGVRDQIDREGFKHWQIVCNFSRAVRRKAVKDIFGRECHAEPTRSEAANSYVWKEETAVEGTRFEFGKPRVNRGDRKDWDAIKSACRDGRLDDIPSDIYVRCYNAIKRISVDNLKPIAVERNVFVFWGATGVGKSREAWNRAGLEAYPKDPRSKFWDGYQNQRHIVIDEFRGGIDISHVLRWFDRYPVIVEVKGSSTVLAATSIWITSNIHPKQWYAELDFATYQALERRLQIFQVLEGGIMCPENSNELVIN